MAAPTTIRKGKVIEFQGEPYLVLDMMHRTQGRQSGFVQATLRNLNTGASKTTKFRSTDSIEFCHTETQTLEFSYVDEQGYHFLNPESFEDYILPKAVVEDQKQFLVENYPYDVLFVNEKAVQIQLSAAVEMTVVNSPEGIKGDTATGAQKPAVTNSGLTVQVPLFIKEGEKIRVSTADGTYLGRA